MPIEIQPDEEIADMAWVQITGDFDWSEYHRHMDMILDYIKERARPTDIVLLPPSGFPKGNPLPHMRTAYRRFMLSPYLRRMVIIERRSNALANMLFYVLVRIGMIDARRFFRVASAEAAVDALRSRETT